MYPWTPLFHPKYRAVTWILIINIFLVGMNGNFTYKTGVKLVIKYFNSDNTQDIGGIIKLAATLESIKFIGIFIFAKHLAVGTTNRNLVFLKYSKTILVYNFFIFFNISLIIFGGDLPRFVHKKWDNLALIFLIFPTMLT